MMTPADVLKAKPEALRTLLEEARFQLARQDFKAFLGHCQVLDPEKGVIPFEVWPHLGVVADTLAEHRLVVILKAKQIGLSWEAAAYALWTAQYHQGARVLLYSQGELYSRELLSKVRFIYDHLPTALKVPLKGEGNSQELSFPSLNAQILALPSTKSAGIGFAATLVVMDEADFFDFLAENYDTAARPTVAAGGQIVLLSTANPEHMVSPFRDLYRNAGDGTPGPNGFIRLFFPWDVRPGRSEDWQSRERAAAMDVAIFEKNYPDSAEQALAPAQALAAFDLDALGEQRRNVRKPLETRGQARIWQRFTVGHPYAAASDVGWGIGQDYSVTVVLDCRTGQVVADVMSNVLAPDVFTYESDLLLADYKRPLWAPEDNDQGHVVIAKAIEMKYPRLYKPKDREGWHTDDRSRWLMWGELREAIKAGLISIPCEDGLSQFFSVILNPKNRGRPEAMQGAHDDYPTAAAIVWQMRKEVGLSVPLGKPLLLPRPG